MTTTINTTIEEQAADMMESGADVPGCMPDEAVADACRDLACAAMLLDDAPTDIEARLHDFHRRHRRRVRTLWVAVAAAACAAVLLVVTLTNNRQVDLDSSPIAYTEVRNLKGVTIVGQRGHKTLRKAENVVQGKVFDVLDESESDIVLTAAVPTGSAYEMLLSDGTRVLMHSNSRLVFPSRFTGGRREVRLDGEAYFVVAHDAEHPFVVHGGTMTTEVLGTEFYVRAYGDGGDNVTLISGKVRAAANGKSIVMVPGQQASVAAGGSMAVSSVDVSPYEYWRDGYLFYDHTSLRNIVKSIAHDNAYGVEFKAMSGLDREMHFVADRTHGIGPVLNALSAITGIGIRAEGTQIVVE